MKENNPKGVIPLTCRQRGALKVRINRKHPYWIPLKN